MQFLIWYTYIYCVCASQTKGPVIIYGIYQIWKNRSWATEFFVVICMGYEIFLAQKIWVKNFFPFVDMSVAGKLHFRYKMHVETYTHDVLVFTKRLLVCSSHGILASASFHVISCLHKIFSRSTFVSLSCHSKIDLFLRHKQTKLIYTCL